MPGLPPLQERADFMLAYARKSYAQGIREVPPLLDSWTAKDEHFMFNMLWRSETEKQLALLRVRRELLAHQVIGVCFLVEGWTLPQHIIDAAVETGRLDADGRHSLGRYADHPARIEVLQIMATDWHRFVFRTYEIVRRLPSGSGRLGTVRDLKVRVDIEDAFGGEDDPLRGSLVDMLNLTRPEIR